MAHTPGTSPRIQRLSALVAILAVAASIALAFGRVLIGGPATMRLLAVGVASGVIAWATERRGMLLATACSAAGLVFAMSWIAAVHATWFGVPTLETFRTLGTLATQVGGQAREYVSPAPATPALLLATTVAVWAAVFSCYALAFRAQSPLLALVPPLALIVFADSALDHTVRPLFGVAFLVAALAVLFADSLRRIQGWGPIWSPAGRRDRLTPAAGRNARRVGATALVVAVMAPLFMPGFGSHAVLSLSSVGSGGKIQLSPLVSIGGWLRQAEDDNPALFQVVSARPAYWRMVALDDFNGTTWQATPDTGEALGVGGTIPNQVVQGDAVKQVVTVETDRLSGELGWLVAAGEPVAVSIDHDVSWHPASSSLQLTEWPGDGEQYTVTSVRPNPTAKDLRATGLAQVGLNETEVPEPEPPEFEQIRQIANDWTKDAETPFDKVATITQRLTTAPFTYSLDDVGNRDDPATLLDMLTVTHKGFCQQYASLMALMLRLIGIPARVALGFKSGDAIGAATYTVRADDYHSWVEVPFEGQGWLPFDPTPGSQAGDPSFRYMNQAISAQAPCDTAAPNRSPLSCRPGGGKGQVIPRDIRGHPHELGTTSVASLIDAQKPPPHRSSVPVFWILLALAVLIAIAVPLLTRVRRRHRLHAATDPRTLVLATYDVWGDRLAELGWGRGPGETPQEFRGRLAGAEALDEPGRESLDRLTLTVVRAAYAPEPPEPSAAKDVSRDTEAVLEEIRGATPLKQRLLGLYRRDRL